MTNKLSEHKDFEINTSNLKNVRTFAREIFKKFPELDNQHEELVLALAEAAQNIVKHSYNSIPSTDTMRIQIVYEDNLLTMELFDKGRPVIPANIKPRKLEDIKAGGLGTFFIGQIMDEVIFKTSKTNWINHLILKKKIN
jgi:serine/threonine-protein kinase RsbW|tara:strand:- start:28 stop:447 length:420 start_codon:yes stop_codon:yes gene_type:complete